VRADQRDIRSDRQDLQTDRTAAATTRPSAQDAAEIGRTDRGDEAKDQREESPCRLGSSQCAERITISRQSTTISEFRS
jgi:hypothetical protein